MSLLKKIFGIREIKSPVFYKEFSEESNHLIELIDLENKVKSSKKEDIKKDIESLKDGIIGERKVYDELKNSPIPMICLHDVMIQDGDYTARLDFIVITEKFIMILEAKNFAGEIYIDKAGDFIRYINDESEKVIGEEKIYSPIVQNDNNIRIVRNMMVKEGLISNTPVLSAIVLSNPKSIVDKTKAPDKIRDEVFMYNKISEFLRRKINLFGSEGKISEEKMKKIGEMLVESNENLHIDYNLKYALSEIDFMEQQIKEKADEVVQLKEIEEAADEGNIENEDIVDEMEVHDKLVEALEEYRFNKSKEVGIKPYFVFNDDMIEDIIKLKPLNKKELIQIRGFGPEKISKYGQDIVDIISM